MNIVAILIIIIFVIGFFFLAKFLVWCAEQVEKQDQQEPIDPEEILP